MINQITFTMAEHAFYHKMTTTKINSFVYSNLFFIWNTKFDQKIDFIFKFVFFFMKKK